MLERLAHAILRHRTIVLVTGWLALTAFGGFAAPHAVDRLLTTFSIPGSSAYKANQQVVKAFGNGDQQPTRRRVPTTPRATSPRCPPCSTALRAGAGRQPGCAGQLVLQHEEIGHLRVEGQAHDVRRDLSRPARPGSAAAAPSRQRSARSPRRRSRG